MMKKDYHIPDKNPFRVPDNYFEELNRKIISVTSGHDKEIRKSGLFEKYRTSFLIAASIAGFILISYSALRLFTTDKKKSQVSEFLHVISPDSIIGDIDISSLEEDAASLIISEEGSGASKKDIIDYLILDNIEINDIYAQL
jgi:hypothetical protein